MKHLRLRREIVATARRMLALGLTQGTSGNVSARLHVEAPSRLREARFGGRPVLRSTAEGGRKAGAQARAGERFLVTPSGVRYEDMRPSDIVEMGFDGKVVGDGAPSTEWRFHRAILAARPEVNAVVHAHAMFATTLSCLGLDIPAFHYMIAVAGGRSIRCAPYATFGTEELSRHALAALEGRRACLLANHGMIAVGGSLADALALAVEVETLAAQYWRALQVGKPVILSDEEMDTVLEKFETYGRRASPPPRRRP